jgi:hypothetical protein
MPKIVRLGHYNNTMLPYIAQNTGFGFRTQFREVAKYNLECSKEDSKEYSDHLLLECIFGID